ncbi:MAG: CHAT domain-containing protein [Microscillaceae bacterium]|jgi:CHAT domain-containing protein|nr:CHAT domain-containing protein [Microscillaceae bacterium]
MKILGLGILFLLIFNFLSAQTDTLSARRWFREGIEALEKADYEKSFHKLSQAREAYQKSANWLMSVNCQNKLVQNLIRQGKFEQALQAIQEIEQYGLKKLNPKSPQEAESYNLQGEVYLNKGRNDLALQNFQEALDIYKKFHPGHKQEIALAYNNIGLVHFSTQKHELALEHHQQSLNIRQTLHGEKHPETGASYNNIGLVYAQYDLSQAQEYYQKALKIYLDVYGEKHPTTANAYNNLAIVYQKEQRYEDALNNFDKVLTIRQKVYGNEHPNIAFVYAYMGETYFEQANYFEALAYYKKALKIYQKNYGEKHPEIANIFNQIGVIYVQQKKYNLALEHYQQAICANISGGCEADILFNPDLKEYYNGRILLNSLLIKAQALEARHFGKTLKLKDLTLALQTLETCDRLIERIRQANTNQSDKIALGILASEVYEDGIRICYAISEVVLNKKNYWEKAFYFAEKSKSAVLLAAISETDAKDFANIPTNLLEQEKQLKTDIAFYEQKLAEKPEAGIEKNYREKLFALNRNYEGFVKNLEQKYPEYFNLKYSVKTAQVSDIQSVIDEKTEVLSYFIAEKNPRLYVFQIHQNHFKLYDVAQIENFKKQLISLRNGIQFKAKKNFVESGQILFAQLFPQKLSSRYPKLVIIPDGGLGTIPFEVLLTDKMNNKALNYAEMPFLVKNRAISYTYSATLFWQNRQKNHQTPSASGGIMVCAPVNFNSQVVADLTATAQESQEIANLFRAKNQNVKLLLHKEATEKNIKIQELKNFNILHFATHGTVNEENPELSQIFLLKDSQGKEDGNLTSGEIYNLDINADLVTLSCCETGLGKISKGEGIIGLSRGLLYAGAKNLIVSLWAVGDASTAQLMVDIYQNILNNAQTATYPEAIRLAKLKMLQSSDFQAPYFWAPFILVGR